MKLITNKLSTLLLSLGFALGAFLLPSTTASAQRVALKNNLAYDALLTPNLSFEVALGKKWTLDLQGGANFFLYEKDANSSKYKASPKWSHWLLEPEVRYWTCEKFYGFFVGAHALGGLANVAGVNIPFVLQNKDGVMKDHRYEAWYAGGGLSVGYQWILSDHINIEASVGAGYVRIGYDKYPCVACGKKLDSGKADYVGPTKATLSLVYILK